MKKLFTLLTLALISIGSAWGQETTTTIDFESGAIADVFTESNSAGVSTSIEALSTYEWSSGKKFSSAPTGSTKLFVTSLGSTKGTSTTLITKSSWVGITKISFYIASSDRGKTELAISVSPNADFSSDVTDVLTNTTLSSTDFGNNTSNGTMKQLTFNLDEAKSGYVKIVLSQGSNSNNKIMALDNVVITNDPSAMKVISTQVLGGVKKGATTLTETTDYSISGTTITLTAAHKAISAPTDIKLINHITYTDDTTKDEDVDVTLEKNDAGDFFEGTATIDETEYTVKVPVDNTPTLSLSEDEGDISLKSYEATGKVEVTLTGANLTNGTFTAPTASGVTVTPATVNITDGTINQKFTITSSATTAAETVLAFAYTGATTQNYTLTYSKTAQRSKSQTTISEATTWDWEMAYNQDVQLTDATNPTKSEEFLLSNIAEVKNDENFNAQALKVIAEYPTRKQNSDYMLQGNSISFNTTVPGTVKVYFSNTGGSRPYRYARVNGILSENGSNASTSIESQEIPVAAGEVVIDGYIPDASDPVEREGDVVGTTMLRFYKIIFTPLTGGDVVKVTDAAYATHVLADDIDFTKTDGVTAYKAQVEGDVIKLTEVEQAPAGTPLIIAATGNVYTLEKATSTPAAVTDNDLVAGPVTGDGSSYYVLGKEGDKVGFGLLASGAELPATKAYIPADKFTEARAFIAIDSDVTGIKNIKVGSEDNIYYDLQGRRVLYPTKGLYIVNGKKVILK